MDGHSTNSEGGPQIVVNPGGEGELERAIAVNSLVFPLRRPALWVRPGRFIRADITALPIRAGAATEVIGRKLPMMTSEDRTSVVCEALRVLAPGVLRLHASSGGGHIWLPIENNFAKGVKAE